MLLDLLSFPSVLHLRPTFFVLIQTTLKLMRCEIFAVQADHNCGSEMSAGEIGFACLLIKWDE